MKSYLWHLIGRECSGESKWNRRDMQTGDQGDDRVFLLLLLHDKPLCWRLFSVLPGRAVEHALSLCERPLTADCFSVSLSQITSVINPALDKYFPSDSGVRIIAEPGRYYVASAFTLAVNIIAKKLVLKEQTGSDGMYKGWIIACVTNWKLVQKVTETNLPF